MFLTVLGFTKPNQFWSLEPSPIFTQSTYIFVFFFSFIELLLFTRKKRSSLTRFLYLLVCFFLRGKLMSLMTYVILPELDRWSYTDHAINVINATCKRVLVHKLTQPVQLTLKEIVHDLQRKTKLTWRTLAIGRPLEGHTDVTVYKWRKITRISNRCVTQILHPRINLMYLSSCAPRTIINTIIFSFESQILQPGVLFFFNQQISFLCRAERSLT